VVEPIRFEDVGERHFVGVRQTVEMKTAGQGIMQVWMAFSQVAEVERQKPTHAYGLMPKNDPDSGAFDYMAAYEVDAPAPSHASHAQLTVPAGRYAVFHHPGPAREAQSTWRPIFGEWMPQSDFDHDVLPFQEVYDEAFDPSTGEGGFEIWIPVKPKASAE